MVLIHMIPSMVSSDPRTKGVVRQRSRLPQNYKKKLLLDVLPVSLHLREQSNDGLENYPRYRHA